MFHNTIPLSGDQLTKAKDQATKQADIILSLFQKHPNSAFTPFEVQHYTRMRCPITSIRRAITDLTKSGYLEKTEIRKVGEYGMVNNTWRLKERQTRMF